MQTKRRALISLYDKTGIDELARKLSDFGYDILSTGGTAKALQKAGFAVTEVADVTGAAEYPEGLVKTLHPRIHFALLANRDDPEHMARMEQDGIIPIDIVVCNLYAFHTVADKAEVSDEELRHLIDIGGPTMIRAGAKNWKYVAVLTNPEDYPVLIAELEKGEGTSSQDFRARMAVKAFEHTADYDALVYKTLAHQLNHEQILRTKFVQGTVLRYGENPHQKAISYFDPSYPRPNIMASRQLWGKEISFNNLVDGDAALEAVMGFPQCAVAVVKHTNPCGLASAATARLALETAWEGDIVSAFGSVIACNRPVDAGFMDFLDARFVEMVIAPSFAPDVMTWLQTHKKKNLRVLEVGDVSVPANRLSYKSVHGGMLVQDEDDAVFEKWESVTKTMFPEDKNALGKFSFQALKYIKSNEISIVREYKPGFFHMLGMGAGQPNRVDSIRKLALPKARENLEREAKALGKAEGEIEAYINGQLAQCVLGSGAFFPFRDSIEEIQKIGIRYVVQPGGSVNDSEVIAACDEFGIAMVFTGMRHFKH
ncbi:bifunctional phosphoribosylaminoimidazolecarboxamide formyltransferase/IMP cyclohydrolase [Candidatus Wirthbacteria bacterium CG2_30_54_11]|uniref:Bifunctional purine biosynthesis protein PurH n=1 Tax=Candidatus Wirthbacteria bacterium CG2_30_54_11 TaxID=1817892 RepID=A0A1J5INR3_9BACT|nr:MAG: bifunctional phosphoribosylaminoimidazolecarboxamide formyltransferase/IMP cyclohydrolase [Candidatus Wirthbacteria bacterium CG2_30_54_11]